MKSRKWGAVILKQFSLADMFIQIKDFVWYTVD